MTALAILVIFPFAMLYAAASDLVSMTISNRVSILLALAFPVVAYAAGMAPGAIGAHLGVGLVCLTVAFGMFAAGWMGGGDAKLLAATAVWFGPTTALLEYFLFTSIYGGLLTVGLLTVRNFVQPVTGVDFVDRLLDGETGIPYGIALGLAGLTVYSGSVWIDIAARTAAF
ncbi:prepilin peptidase [Aurantimonas sp. A2-1-M11]|uniref:A24 family peptidase n=1 Tax=Aurantimonas sp. A2-1-M11 TaxID=3113712 RepID=UPI002F927E19